MYLFKKKLELTVIQKLSFDMKTGYYMHIVFCYWQILKYEYIYNLKRLMNLMMTNKYRVTTKK